MFTSNLVVKYIPEHKQTELLLKIRLATLSRVGAGDIILIWSILPSQHVLFHVIRRNMMTLAYLKVKR